MDIASLIAYTLTFLIPLEYLWFSLGGGFALKVIGVIGFAIWLIRKLLVGKVPFFEFTGLFKLTLVFVFLAILSGLVTGNLTDSYLIAAITLISLEIYYLMMFDILDTERQVKILLTILVYAAVLSALTGVFEYKTGRTLSGIPLSLLEGRSYGGAGEPNELCAIMVGIIPIAVMLAKSSRSWLIKITYIPMILLMILAIFLTGSRGGVVSLLFMTIVILAMLPWKARFMWGMVIILALFIGWQFAGQKVLARFESRDSIGRMAMASRLGLWSIAWQAIQDRPIRGFGLGSFPFLVPPSRSSSAGFTMAKNPAQDVAHNSYLSVWVETGLFGVLLFGTILTLAAYKLWAAFRNRPAPFSESWGVLCRGVLVGYSAYLFMGLSLNLQSKKLLWLFLILADVMYKITKGGHDKNQANGL